MSLPFQFQFFCLYNLGCKELLQNWQYLENWLHKLLSFWESWPHWENWHYLGELALFRRNGIIPMGEWALLGRIGIVRSLGTLNNVRKSRSEEIKPMRNQILVGTIRKIGVVWEKWDYLGGFVLFGRNGIVGSFRTFKQFKKIKI